MESYVGVIGPYIKVMSVYLSISEVSKGLIAPSLWNEILDFNRTFSFAPSATKCACRIPFSLSTFADLLVFWLPIFSNHPKIQRWYNFISRWPPSFYSTRGSQFHPLPEGQTTDAPLSTINYQL